MLKIILFCAIVTLPFTLHANVVRPAPIFAWKNAEGTTTTLEKVRGHSAILVITPHVKNWAFRRQLYEIQGAYQSLAAAHVLAFVALTQSLERIPSNIPFVIIANSPQVASAYGASSKFGIAIIGRDGNLDYFSHKVLAGQRIVDIINNSFVAQQAFRR